MTDKVNETRQVVPHVQSHKSHKKTVKVGAQEITSMVTTFKDMAQAMQEAKTGHVAHQSSNPKPYLDKFKIMFHLALKKVSICKGEMITPTYVINVFNAARDIDTAALKATNRQPDNQNEWNSFFQFHLTHMTCVLHEEMVALVHQSKFSDSPSFWTAVYQKIFHAYLAREALGKALGQYMIWSEPLGVERWESITKSILQYQGTMSGKTGEEQAYHIAESFNQQLHRVIDGSVEACSASLRKEFAHFNREMEEA